ncbi:MAG: triose-phosphate isomerase [Flavobacteriales bacterium]|nr:triose-phosphate isomerase [Flavobacteriales bacterium]|tara:strand:- start:3888 stop:4643 length:756 start_codon:yes stop_codon:yes gene_type:complete
MKHIIANWKMNKTKEEALSFVQKLSFFLETNNYNKCNISIAPPFVHLPVLYNTNNSFNLIAQNVSVENFGAFTGEVSAAMLKDYVKHVIVGHSERRKYFNETNELLYKKIKILLENSLCPVFCFGESIHARNKGDYLDFIERQLEDVIMLFSQNELSNILLAYEPVWAIGSGSSANELQINEVHTFVRDLIEKKYGSMYAEKIPILYGGSCNSDNTSIILRQPNVDGLLIGGASLSNDHFHQIIQLANSLD